MSIDLVEHAKGLVLDLGSSTGQRDSDVVNKVFLLVWGLSKNLPELSGLLEVNTVGADNPLVGDGLTNPLLVLLMQVDVLSVLQGLERRGVVGQRAGVAVNSHLTISVVRSMGMVGTVDGDLGEVGTESVSLSIGIREESRLQDGIGRGLPAGDGVGGREGSLLGLSEVVLDVLVKSELTESSERELVVRPDLGEVKDGPLELLSLLGGADLDVTSPRGERATLDGVEEVFLGVVGVGSGESDSLVIGEVLDALVGLHVDLDVVERAILLDPLVGVAGVTVHLSVVSGSTSVGEEDHDLVATLLVVGNVVPHHSGVLEVGLGVSLLSVDENGELGGVSDEKDGGVVVDPVNVSLVGVELGGETSGVSSSIGGSLLSSNGGESSEGLGLLTDLGQEIGAVEVGDIVSDLELSVSTGSLSVDNSLGDSLSVEVGEQVDQGKVLEQERSVLADSLGGEGVLDGVTVSGGVSGDSFSRHFQ